VNLIALERRLVILVEPRDVAAHETLTSRRGPTRPLVFAGENDSGVLCTSARCQILELVEHERAGGDLRRVDQILDHPRLQPSVSSIASSAAIANGGVEIPAAQHACPSSRAFSGVAARGRATTGTRLPGLSSSARARLRVPGDDAAASGSWSVGTASTGVVRLLLIRVATRVSRRYHPARGAGSSAWLRGDSELSRIATIRFTLAPTSVRTSPVIVDIGWCSSSAIVHKGTSALRMSADAAVMRSSRSYLIHVGFESSRPFKLARNRATSRESASSQKRAFPDFTTVITLGLNPMRPYMTVVTIGARKKLFSTL